MADLSDQIGAVLRYVNYGCRPGSFTEAVLGNDLFGAFENTDLTSHLHLLALCTFISNRLPFGSYGSRQAVAMWLDSGGLEKKSWPLIEHNGTTGL